MGKEFLTVRLDSVEDVKTYISAEIMKIRKILEDFRSMPESTRHMVSDTYLRTEGMLTVYNSLLEALEKGEVKIEYESK